MAIRGRGTRRGRGRGRSDPPQPSQSRTSRPPPPPHTSANPGVKNDKNRMQKQGLVKVVDALLKQQAADAHSTDLPPNQQLIRYLKMAIEGRGTRHGRGRGRSDPPQPSQSCTSPPLPASPPLPHTSANPGIKNDKNIMQNQGLVKGIDALKNKQKITTFSSEENEEYYDYDDGEDEEMQLIREKISQQQLLKQHTADANNVKKGIGAIAGVSNSEKMSSATSDSVPHSAGPPVNNPTPLPSSGGSHVETDRRNVISVEAISNPRRFIPQSVTRDIVSTLIMRMPTPSEKWRNYPGKMKDELFKDFMVSIYIFYHHILFIFGDIGVG